MINLSNMLLMGGGGAPLEFAFEFVRSNTSRTYGEVFAGDIALNYAYKTQSDEDGYPGGGSISGWTQIYTATSGGSSQGYKARVAVNYRVLTGLETGQHGYPIVSPSQPGTTTIIRPINNAYTYQGYVSKGSGTRTVNAASYPLLGIAYGVSTPMDYQLGSWGIAAYTGDDPDTNFSGGYNVLMNYT